MTVAYFDESRPQTEARVTAAHHVPGQGFWKRLVARMIAARMRQAEREVARHRHFAKFDPDSAVLASISHRPLGD